MPPLRLLIDVIPKGLALRNLLFPTEQQIPSRNDNWREELQFRIKDQDYFLAFVEQEKRWYVIAPTPQGVHRIPVYVDAVKWGTPVSLKSETTLSS